MKRPRRTWAVLGLLPLLAGCGRSGACSYPETIAFLPRSLRESSGLAASRRRPGVFWTLVDSKGDSAVFAVDRHGTLLQRVRVSGSRNRDWEDLASGPCPDGRGDCLWIAETGDNGEKHGRARLWVIREPGPDARVSEPARQFAATFPGGARDAEALFVMPDGQPYLVSKGGSDRAVELYLFPTSSPRGELVPLQVLQPRVGLIRRVTGAAASPDGRHVALRTYLDFTLFDVEGQGVGLRLREIADSRRTFLQPQGEAIAFAPDGLYFTSEVLPWEVPPLARSVCPAGPPPAQRQLDHSSPGPTPQPDA